jgi:hypothetical protein
MNAFVQPGLEIDAVLGEHPDAAFVDEGPARFHHAEAS